MVLFEKACWPTTAVKNNCWTYLYFILVVIHVCWFYKQSRSVIKVISDMLTHSHESVKNLIGSVLYVTVQFVTDVHLTMFSHRQNRRIMEFWLRCGFIALIKILFVVVNILSHSQSDFWCFSCRISFKLLLKSSQPGCIFWHWVIPQLSTLIY